MAVDGRLLRADGRNPCSGCVRLLGISLREHNVRGFRPSLDILPLRGYARDARLAGNQLAIGPSGLCRGFLK